MSNPGQGADSRAQPPPLGRNRVPNPRNLWASFSGLGKGRENALQANSQGPVGERFLTLFFSNFQFSSWAKIWSTTVMASFP